MKRVFSSEARRQADQAASSGLPMSDQPAPDDAGARIAVASYVATLSADLSTMARRNGLEALGYILEMARLEAESKARQTPLGPNGRP
jgi:hypothetical protein